MMFHFRVEGEQLMSRVPRYTTIDLRIVQEPVADNANRKTIVVERIAEHSCTVWFQYGHKVSFPVQLTKDEAQELVTFVRSIAARLDVSGEPHEIAQRHSGAIIEYPFYGWRHD